MTHLTPGERDESSSTARTSEVIETPDATSSVSHIDVRLFVNETRLEGQDTPREKGVQKNAYSAFKFEPASSIREQA